jgi:hypothetical protein
MKKGKEPMRTFGDLMQFFEAKTDSKKPSPPNKREHGDKRAPAVADASPAEAAPEPTAQAAEFAVPAAGNPVEVNLGPPPPAPPPSPEPVLSVPPPPGEPSPESQTPSPDEGQ